MFDALMKTAADSVRQLQDMQRAQLRLLAGAQHDPAAGDAKTHPLVAPLVHVQRYQELIGNAASRQLTTWQALWLSALRPGFDAGIQVEGLQMLGAAFQRLASQQSQFLQGLQSLADEAGRAGNASTMSKLMEQEYDISARFGALLVAQATSLVELMESVQIGCGYILAQKVEADAGRPTAEPGN